MLLEESVMIKVENLTKYYGKNCAVKDLTFHAEKGEVLGFLGPNGAGKTTTMRILTGYMPPTSGKVTITQICVSTNTYATWENCIKLTA